MSQTLQIILNCMALAAQTYDIPPTALYGIYKAEGGYVGAEILNKNGTHDLGVMQINTVHLKDLSKHWGLPKDTIQTTLKNDACVNIDVAAWLLRGHYEREKDIFNAIAAYHSRTPKYGKKYKNRVVNILKNENLLE